MSLWWDKRNIQLEINFIKRRQLQKNMEIGKQKFDGKFDYRYQTSNKK